jgi:hypothetical protein
LYHQLFSKKNSACFGFFSMSGWGLAFQQKLHFNRSSKNSVELALI